MIEIAKQLKTITAGRLVTACLYTVPKYLKSDSPYQRAERRKISTAGRTAINNRTSAQTFEGLVFCNFGRGDLYITLTYRPDKLPATRRDVLRDFKRFRRRLLAAGWPKPIKYIYVPEHRHGEGRWHLHVILSGSGYGLGIVRWDIEQAWDLGIVDVRPLSSQVEDILELSRYLTKERPEVGDRGFIPSVGLRRPDIESRRVPDRETLAAPPGSKTLGGDSRCNPFGEYQWVKYLCPESERGAGKN